MKDPRAVVKGIELEVKKVEVGRITWRSVLLGLFLIPINIWWVVVVEVKWYTLDGSCLPLFVTPVFMLFLIVLLNQALRKLKPKLAFTRTELIVVYVMLVVSETMAGHDTLQNLMGSIGHAFWYASPENRWDELFHRYIPKWLMMFDMNALRGFYEGGTSFYREKYIIPWIKPLFFWAVFVMLLVWVMACINIMIRRQWAEREKLSYPIVRLPVEITKETAFSDFFRNKVMWYGFGTAFSIGVLNGLHYLNPAVPWIKYIKLYNIGIYFTEAPWDAMGWTPISMYPFMIGLAFFLPADLSFSCWFFYVFRKMQQVVGKAAGLHQVPGFPFFNEQASGGWIALAIVALFASRRQIAAVWKKALGMGVALDKDEPMSYRATVLGFIAGVIGLFLFSRAMGMSYPFIIVFFSIYFLLSLAMTRVRAELGSPHEIYFVNPHDIMAATLGTRIMDNPTKTAMACFYWFNRCYRNHPMPNQIEAFKMAEETGTDNRGLLKVIIAATAFSIFFVYWAHLHLLYREGAAIATGYKDWVGWESFNRLARWMNEPSGPQGTRIAAMIGGFVFTFFLKYMRTLFVWWPFHPAGYALAVSFAMDYFWFAFFVSWLIKTVIIRYGGMKAHRNAIPFFFGLILGDYTIGSIWAIIGPVWGRSTYKIFI